MFIAIVFNNDCKDIPVAESIFVTHSEKEMRVKLKAIANKRFFHNRIPKKFEELRKIVLNKSKFAFVKKLYNDSLSVI